MNNPIKQLRIPASELQGQVGYDQDRAKGAETNDDARLASLDLPRIDSGLRPETHLEDIEAPEQDHLRHPKKGAGDCGEKSKQDIKLRARRRGIAEVAKRIAVDDRLLRIGRVGCG